MAKLVYAPEPFPDSFTRAIFLVGPTPRDQMTGSWRPDALTELAAAGFDRPGDVVFVPEPRGGTFATDYDNQVAWESEGLELADAIVAWVPRSLPAMPAFTTNVEFGLWCASTKMVFGAPPDAAKVRYLFSTADRFSIPTFTDLPSTVAAALTLVGDGACRTGAERFVPAFVWNTPTFQHWYAARRSAGHELVGARLRFVLRPAPDQPPFAWALHVELFVPEEDRVKGNEVVFGRSDTSAVVAYRPGPTRGEHLVVLVREVRAPAATADGCVHELPGGSSPSTTDARHVAVSELAEETGLVVDPTRFTDHGSRQLLATFSAHRTHLFSLELTDVELEALQAAPDAVFGDGEEERTTVEVVSFAELLNSRLADWSTIGMVAEVLDTVSPGPPP